MASAAHPARLDALAQEAAFKLKRSNEYLRSASILLAECKQRIEAGDPDAQGLTWSEYCRVHCPLYPPSYLHRLVRRHLFPDDDCDDHESSTGSPDPFDRAWAVFITLAPARQQEFLRCGAAYALARQGLGTHSGFKRPPGALDWKA